MFGQYCLNFLRLIIFKSTNIEEFVNSYKNLNARRFQNSYVLKGYKVRRLTKSFIRPNFIQNFLF